MGVRADPRGGATVTDSNLTLPAPGELHLWVAELDMETETTTALDLLRSDERARAERLLSTAARHRFIMTRGLLRKLLERYLEQPAADIQLTSKQGKPGLAQDPAPLSFNVAHSHRRAAIVFAEGGNVGVDVEYLDRHVDHERLARRVFSENEYRSYEESETATRQRMFFDAWSRKEAVLKACGHGLRLPPRQTEVSLAPGEPVFMVRSAGQRWHVRGINVDDDYACAVAADNEFTAVTQRLIATRHLDDMLQHSCS